MSDDPETVVTAWLDGSIPPTDLNERLRLSPSQTRRVRRAARMAALQAYRRVLSYRQMLAAMALGRSTDDLTERVLRAWLAGDLAAVHAAELIGCTVASLDDFARQHGLLTDND